LALAFELGLVLPDGLGLDPLAFGQRRALGRLLQATLELGLDLLGLVELLLDLLEHQLERASICPGPGLERFALGGEPRLRFGFGRLEAALLFGADAPRDLDELLVGNRLPTPGTCILVLYDRGRHRPLQEKTGPRRTLFHPGLRSRHSRVSLTSSCILLFESDCLPDILIRINQSGVRIKPIRIPDWTCRPAFPPDHGRGRRRALTSSAGGENAAFDAFPERSRPTPPPASADNSPAAAASATAS